MIVSNSLPMFSQVRFPRVFAKDSKSNAKPAGNALRGRAGKRECQQPTVQVLSWCSPGSVSVWSVTPTPLALVIHPSRHFCLLATRRPADNLQLRCRTGPATRAVSDDDEWRPGNSSLEVISNQIFPLGNAR